jgi:hypothetical protein
VYPSPSTERGLGGKVFNTPHHYLSRKGRGGLLKSLSDSPSGRILQDESLYERERMIY